MLWPRPAQDREPPRAPGLEGMSCTEIMQLAGCYSLPWCPASSFPFLRRCFPPPSCSLSPSLWLWRHRIESTHFPRPPRPACIDNLSFYLLSTATLPRTPKKPRWQVPTHKLEGQEDGQGLSRLQGEEEGDFQAARSSHHDAGRRSLPNYMPRRLPRYRHLK